MNCLKNTEHPTCSHFLQPFICFWLTLISGCPHHPCSTVPSTILCWTFLTNERRLCGWRCRHPSGRYTTRLLKEPDRDISSLISWLILSEILFSPVFLIGKLLAIHRKMTHLMAPVAFNFLLPVDFRRSNTHGSIIRQIGRVLRGILDLCVTLFIWTFSIGIGSNA